MSEPIQLKTKDFKSDQEVRWCPGCGDYAILAAVQGFMPELGVPRENIVFVSGIGCAARFPYYMQTFVARTIDTDKQGMVEVLRAAASHPGAAFVEILQNCNIYNDGAWDVVRDEKENRLYLREGEEIRWGDKGVRMRSDGTLEVVDADAGGLLVHDPARDDPGLSFALARLTWKTAGCVPLGIFRDVERPVYDEDVRAQLDEARERKGEGDLAALIAGNDTWVIE